MPLAYKNCNIHDDLSFTGRLKVFYRGSRAGWLARSGNPVWAPRPERRAAAQCRLRMKTVTYMTIYPIRDSFLLAIRMMNDYLKNRWEEA